MIHSNSKEVSCEILILGNNGKNHVCLTSSMLCSDLVATRETYEKLFKIPVIRILHSRPGWRTQRANSPVTGAISKKKLSDSREKV